MLLAVVSDIFCWHVCTTTQLLQELTLPLAFATSRLADSTHFSQHMMEPPLVHCACYWSRQTHRCAGTSLTAASSFKGRGRHLNCSALSQITKDMAQSHESSRAELIIEVCPPFIKPLWWTQDPKG